MTTYSREYGSTNVTQKMLHEAASTLYPNGYTLDSQYKSRASRGLNFSLDGVNYFSGKDLYIKLNNIIDKIHAAKAN